MKRVNPTDRSGNGDLHDSRRIPLDGWKYRNVGLLRGLQPGKRRVNILYDATKLSPVFAYQ